MKVQLSVLVLFLAFFVGSSVQALDELTVEDVSLSHCGTGTARILMTNDSGPAFGYAVAIAHSPVALVLTDINLDGTVADGADFFLPIIFPDGGAAGVVLDFFAECVG